MAGDWIKVENVTPEKPEVAGIAEELGITAEEAMGRLLLVWIWADEQSVDGNAIRVTPASLDRYARRDGFCAAMQKVGWVVVRKDGLFLPNFDRHNGKTAKKRALGARRASRFRNANHNAVSVTQSSLNSSLDSRDTPTHTTSQESQEGRLNGYGAAAREVLAFLNERTGKAFQPTSANLDLIVARLREGYTDVQCRQVIVRKVREWQGDDKMAGYLRPATLFNREKFNQYAGELVADKAPAGEGA